MFLRREYSIMLGLYPADFRAQFGGEMLAVFEQAAEHRRPRSGASLLLFFASEMLGLVAGAARERVLAADAVRSHGDLPFPSDVAGAEKYLEIVSKRLINAIANHDFVNARYYDQ